MDIVLLVLLLILLGSLSFLSWVAGFGFLISASCRVEWTRWVFLGALLLPFVTIFVGDVFFTPFGVVPFITFVTAILAWAQKSKAEDPATVGRHALRGIVLWGVAYGLATLFVLLAIGQSVEWLSDVWNSVSAEF